LRRRAGAGWATLAASAIPLDNTLLERLRIRLIFFNLKAVCPGGGRTNEPAIKKKAHEP